MSVNGIAFSREPPASARRRLFAMTVLPIGTLDTMIAAHALALNCVMVTNNTREFSRVPGLRLENWAE